MTFKATFPLKPGKKPTKTALKEAIYNNPEKVRLQNLDLMGAQAGWSGRADELPVGWKADVVGPDPYTDRRWYATITRKATGLTIS